MVLEGKVWSKTHLFVIYSVLVTIIVFCAYLFSMERNLEKRETENNKEVKELILEIRDAINGEIIIENGVQ